MKNLVTVIAIVAVFTAGLSTAATCLILSGMAREARRSSSLCVDGVTYDATTCPFPEQKIEVWPADHNHVLVKCLCPHPGAK